MFLICDQVSIYESGRHASRAQKFRKYTPPLQSRYDSGARSGLPNYVIRLRNSECGIGTDSATDSAAE